MDELGIRDKPQNIWNVDETCFSTNQGNKKIFVDKSVSNPISLVANREKINYTVQVNIFFYLRLKI
jgi:hypothetical protein